MNIVIDEDKIANLMEKFFQPLKQAVYNEEASSDEIYFTLNCIIFLNQIAAQEENIPIKRLKLIEKGALEYIAKRFNKKKTKGMFYN